MKRKIRVFIYRGSTVQGKMMLDTAMKFLAQGSGQTSSPCDTLYIMKHLDRFLGSTHYLINDLKERFIKQVIMLGGKIENKWQP